MIMRIILSWRFGVGHILIFLYYLILFYIIVWCICSSCVMQRTQAVAEHVMIYVCIMMYSGAPLQLGERKTSELMISVMNQTFESIHSMNA